MFKRCYYLCVETVDALNAFKIGLADPSNALQSWDPILVNPCTWSHVTCNNNNSVTRVYAFFYISFYTSGIDFCKERTIELWSILCLPMLSDLGNANLSGQLVPQLGLLPNLLYL